VLDDPHSSGKGRDNHKEYSVGKSRGAKIRKVTRRVS
jgi:hypothetical protein